MPRNGFPNPHPSGPCGRQRLRRCFRGPSVRPAASRLPHFVGEAVLPRTRNSFLIVHPAVELRFPARSGSPAPTRHSCGTRGFRLGLLPSGSDPIHSYPAAQDPVFNACVPGARPAPRKPSGGDSAPHLEGFGFRAPLAPRLARSPGSVPAPGGLWAGPGAGSVSFDEEPPLSRVPVEHDAGPVTGVAADRGEAGEVHLVVQRSQCLAVGI